MATNQSLMGTANKVSGFPSDMNKDPKKKLRSVADVNAICFSVIAPRLRKNIRKNG